MNMKKPTFRLLKSRNQNGSETEKRVEQVAVVGHTAEAVGWHPVSYRFPDRWTEFQTGFAKNVSDMISKGKPDMYNAHFFDELIDQEVRIALSQLDEQRCEHRRVIHSIRVFQNAYQKNLEYGMARLEKELEKDSEREVMNNE